MAVPEHSSLAGAFMIERLNGGGSNPSVPIVKAGCSSSAFAMNYSRLRLVSSGGWWFEPTCEHNSSKKCTHRFFPNVLGDTKKIRQCSHNGIGKGC